MTAEDLFEAEWKMRVAALEMAKADSHHNRKALRTAAIAYAKLSSRLDELDELALEGDE